MKGGSHNDEEVAGEHATGMIVDGLQAAEEAKEISVPPHQRVGTHDRQELTPFDKSRQEYECNARRIVSPTRSDLAFGFTARTAEQSAAQEVLDGLFSRPRCGLNPAACAAANRAPTRAANSSGTIRSRSSRPVICSCSGATTYCDYRRRPSA